MVVLIANVNTTFDEAPADGILDLPVVGFRCALNISVVCAARIYSANDELKREERAQTDSQRVRVWNDNKQRHTDRRGVVERIGEHSPWMSVCNITPTQMQMQNIM